MAFIKKQLHMASNLDQLKEKSNEMKILHSLKKDPTKLMVGVQRLNDKLQDSLKRSEQDEEMIYFLSFRILSLWQALQLTDEFKSDSKYYKCMIGKEVMKALKKMEEMNISLKRRYATEIRKDTDNKYLESCDLAESSEITQAVPQVKEPVSISCKELQEKILANENLIVIDTRPKYDFDRSRLSKVKLINIPSDLIKPGISAAVLGNKLPTKQDKIMWDDRNLYKQIIMLDWNTVENTFCPGSTLHVLKNIFLKWDPTITYKETPLILDGGYEKFLDQYPFLTTNPNPERPKVNDSITFVPLDEIVYPITDLTEKLNEVMKPPSAEPPSVDRSTKPTEVEVENKSYPQTAKKIDVSDAMLEPKETVVPKPIIKQTEGSSTITPSATGPSETNVDDIGGGGSDIPSTRIKKDDHISPSFSSGLTRSRSSPNISQLLEDADLTPKAKPHIDRTSKPSPRSSDSFTPRSHGSVPRGLTGLKNLGNLCYMNSIIQCVSNTEELKKQLISINTPCRINRNSKTKGQVYDAVKQLICLLHQGAYRWVTCSHLKSVVGQFRNTFAGCEQQDSHEFLTELMDWLHEDLNCPTPNLSLEGASDETGERAWGEFKKKNESIVLELFYGQLRSTITCCECHKQSITFDPFSNLSLPLPMDKDHCKLSDCITLYLTGETISGWNCPRCKEPRQAVKKFDITRLPPVLVIHLKRFMTEGLGTGWSRKRPNMVDFPLEELDMKNYTANSEQRFHTYNLYAVSNHYGTMDSGHYTAYCKNYTYNKWYKFDDQEVVELSSLEVCSTAAYILFYSTIRS